ncbi:MAG: hypothetical protein HYS60_01805, partial [Candidatus Wildermuthbacteria bacterium]|nr:hypothetical protein [Candidatus Wildermuthbacteria bacterium]
MQRFLKIAFFLGTVFAFFFLLSSTALAATQCQEPYTGYLGCFPTAEDCSIEGGTYPIYANDLKCYACYTGCTSSEAPPPSECPAAPADPSGYVTKSSETEYSCQSNLCQGNFLSRTKTETCKTNYIPQKNEADCVIGWEFDSYSDCSTSFGSPASQSCGSYQTCNGTDEWSPAYPCQCSGICYPAPNLKSLDDSSLSPQNVFEDAAKTKVKLPVNVG